MNGLNRGAKVKGVKSILTLAGVAATGALLSACSTGREVQNSFDVGTSQGPRVQAETPARQKGQMLVASDSLGSQVFREDTSAGAYAAVPEE